MASLDSKKIRAWRMMAAKQAYRRLASVWFLAWLVPLIPSPHSSHPIRPQHRPALLVPRAPALAKLPKTTT